MLQALISYLASLPKELTTFVLAMLPVSELRGAIPFGLASGLGLPKVLALAIIGNLVPVIPILFLLKPVSEYLRKFWLFKKFFDWLFERTRRKAKLVERYEFLGLILFVAIPLPVTGAWTGCVAAGLFKIRLRYAILAIAIGVCLAAVIVTVVCAVGKGVIFNLLIPSH
ncbi:MAG: small multi-drug export protein [Candidatus Omnitrophica bacterium]|nr:small multi-drug export protein [Candidatus Omnitrophota bacterium]